MKSNRLFSSLIPHLSSLHSGGILSVALSLPPGPYRTGRAVRAGAVAVSHHRALWSPDFPPPACAGGDRPAGPRRLNYTPTGLIITTDTRLLARVRGWHVRRPAPAPRKPAAGGPRRGRCRRQL